jgi:hypothetical protein
LLEDKKIQNLIAQLDKRVEATWENMASIGVVRECTDCALNGGGSCCGAGMEEMYDEIILLINLLLGKTFPEQAYDPSLCYFLSERGCTLWAREVICVNYLCQQIYKGIEHEKLIHLQRIAGEELKTLFTLEESIKKKISQSKETPNKWQEIYVGDFMQNIL